MVLASGRSWWQARYSDGRILSEWETLQSKVLLPSSTDSSSRWEEAPKDNMVDLKLLCPNGLIGGLGAKEGHKFFQLKSARVNVGNKQHHVDAHIIGVIEDITGTCLCRAWDYNAKRLIEFNDNVYNMGYLNIGRINLGVQGLRI